MPDPFKRAFDELPEELAIFPLPGVAVMPGMQIPLNIFEPRYLNMVFDALATHRMIGMAQPDPTAREQEPPSVFRTGTAGRITSFSETNDGRLMIILTGVCRFDIQEELAAKRDYRRVKPDWSRFAADYQVSEAQIPDRPGFFQTLESYCEIKEVEISWQEAKKLKDASLIDLLMTHLPFNITEKQALIESIDLGQRILLLQSFLEMSNAQQGKTADTRH
jgi:hypothetical protein